MKKLRKFLSLSSSDRRFLIKSTVLVGTVRLALWLLPFRTSLNLVDRLVSRNIHQKKKHQVPEDQVVWAITAASRYIPAATCLTQALAAQVLLRNQGHIADLRIGVARNEKGLFQAHAWIESQGKVVIGDLKDLSRYSTLPPLEGTVL